MKSELFLDRFRLLALVDEIIQTDATKTPQEHRTIGYFVENYRKRFLQRDRFRRLISVEGDSDVDEGHSTKKARHMRHVPRSEVAAIFAAHAEWLLAYQLASRNHQQRRVNIQKWIGFCRTVWMRRNGARAAHKPSNIPDNKYLRGLALRLARYGRTADVWRTILERVYRVKKAKKVLHMLPPLGYAEI